MILANRPITGKMTKTAYSCKNILLSVARVGGWLTSSVEVDREVITKDINPLLYMHTQAKDVIDHNPLIPSQKTLG